MKGDTTPGHSALDLVLLNLGTGGSLIFGAGYVIVEERRHDKGG